MRIWRFVTSNVSSNNCGQNEGLETGMNCFEDQGETTTFHTLCGHGRLNTKDQWTTMSLNQGLQTNMD